MSNAVYIKQNCSTERVVTCKSVVALVFAYLSARSHSLSTGPMTGRSSDDLFIALALP